MHSNELFERITQRIIADVEAGAGQFKMPWHRWGEALATPINATTERPYRGVNVLMLWAAAEVSGYSSGRWATYRQFAAAGAQVRKGEKSTPILFWKTSTAGAVEADDAEGATPTRRLLSKVYSVFNADQVENLRVSAAAKLPAIERIQNAERFFEAVGADVRYGGDRACFIPSLDQICMPKFQQFCDAEAFYSTLAHETVHWTGAKHRLARDLSGRFGTDAYAMEELVAELGAAFMAGHLQISVEPRKDHSAYIKSWVRVLRGDPRAILTASSKAQEAADYLIAIAKPDAATDTQKIAA